MRPMAPKTDYGIYDPPALPALPAGGGTFTDPTFGTTIMRLTDAGDGASYCRVQYSYWPTLNCDNTRAIYLTTDPPFVGFYTINQPAFTRGARTLPTGDPGLDWNNGGYWHQTNPDVYYSLAGTKLYSYNVATNTFTVVKDFITALPANRRLYQPAMSDDRSIFAATVRETSSGSFKGVFAYNLSTGTVLKYDETLGARMNEAHLSGDGRYLTVDCDGPQTVTVYDLIGGIDATIAITADGPSHNTATVSDVVSCTAFNTNRMAKWPLVNFAPGARVDLGPDFNFTVTGTLHLSALCANKNWVLVSCTDANPGVSGAFHQELFLVSTTGDKQVYRFCHPRSFFAVYEDSTFANISADGKFVAFSSNWGGSSRRDVFIVSIPNSPAGSGPAPNPPDPIPVPPVTRRVAWPKQEAKQDIVLNEQWALGYRLKRNLGGDFAEFEKVR